jgi:hypothetical protein
MFYLFKNDTIFFLFVTVFVVVVLVELGFELRASWMQSRCSTLGYLGDGGLENCLPRLASNLNPPK